MKQVERQGVRRFGNIPVVTRDSISREVSFGDHRLKHTIVEQQKG